MERSQDTGDSKVVFGGTALLIVDPQMDFHEGGSLDVPGATADAERIAQLVADHSEKIDEIFVTLDSHHCLDIAHPHFWTDKSGSHPTPFTKITAKDVAVGRWTPVQQEHRDHCIEYTKKLEAGRKFTLCVWPEHCLIGTTGHAVHPQINEAIQDWAVAQKKTVTYVMKGQYTLSEQYSCFKAEVSVVGDDSNERGKALLDQMCQLDSILLCGQASSHCVNYSARDLAAAWKHSAASSDENGVRKRMQSLVLLRDGTSPVPGFEKEAANFFADMVGMGVTVRTCRDAFPL